MKKLFPALFLRRPRTTLLSLAIIFAVASFSVSVSSNPAGPLETKGAGAASPATQPQARAVGNSPLFTNPLFSVLMPAVTITATMSDQMIEVDGDNKADVGETIRYTVTINNSGDAVTGVNFALTAGTGTTYVANSLNAAPLAQNDSYNAIGNTLLKVGVAASAGDPEVVLTGSVKDNDLEFLSDTASVVPISNGNSTNGGTVNMNADGTFTYLPPVGFTGADTFTYTLKDDGADNIAGNADDLSDTATVTINLSNRVWYVDNTYAGANGASDGRSTRPFTDAASLDGAGGAGDSDSNNDFIYIFTGSGNYTLGIPLEAGQSLIGNGVPLVVNSITLRAAGTKPSMVVASGNAVSATDVTDLTIRGLTLTATGVASNAIDVTLTGAFAGNGNIEIGDNTISGAVAEGIDLNFAGTGTQALSLHNNAVTASGNGIDVTRPSGGVITITAFNDNAVSSTTGGIGINVTSTGSTINFDSNTGSAGFQQVAGGNTVIGAAGAGNGVGASGLVLSNIRGDISFSDLDIYTDNGTALLIDSTSPNHSVNGTTGALISASGGNAVLSAVNGAALDAKETKINLVLSSLTASGTAATGVSLVETGGTLTVPTGSSINTIATTADFFINGNSNSNANVAVSYAGTISADTGKLVNIQNVTASSTHSFTGLITDNADNGAADGTEQGITLTGNTGANITFSGGVIIEATTFPAFTATGGGTVTVTDPASGINRLETTTGTALTVTSTNIGASGLTFERIDTNGAANGILLSATGTAGGVTVTGIGTTLGSGGTIQNTTGDGVSLNNSHKLTLKNMDITNAASAVTNAATCNFENASGCQSAVDLLGASSDITLDRLRIDHNDGGQAGITGVDVNKLTVTNTTILEVGNADAESAVILQNPQGIVLFTDVTIDDPAEYGIRVFRTSGTLDMTLTRVTVQNNQAKTFGEAGFSIRATSTSNSEVLVDDCDFLNTDGPGVDGQAIDTAVLHMTVQSTTFTENWALPMAVNFTTDNTSQGFVKIHNNTVNDCATIGNCSVAFDLDANRTSTLHAIVTNNSVPSGTGIGTGMEFVVGDGATGRAEVRDNNITVNNVGTSEIGMTFHARNEGFGGTNGRLDVTLEGNTINGVSSGGLFIPGVQFLAGSSTGTHDQDVCVNVATSQGSGNNSINGTNSPGLTPKFEVRQRTGTTFILQGFGGNGTVATDVASYFDSNNSGTLDPAFVGTGGTNIVNYTSGTCNLPTAPTLPATAMNLIDNNNQRQYFARTDGSVQNDNINPLFAFLFKTAANLSAQNTVNQGAQPEQTTASVSEESVAPFTSKSAGTTLEASVDTAPARSEIEKGAMAHASGGSPSLTSRLSGFMNTIVSTVAPTAHAANAPPAAPASPPLPPDIDANLGNLPSGVIVTLVFDVTVNAPQRSSYSNQGTVTANGGAVSLVTDDPDTVAADDPTVTPGDCQSTVTVINSNDSGAGSLRQALIGVCHEGTVNFDMNTVTSPISLTSGGLSVDRSVTVNGPGADQLTVQRSSASKFRIFSIASGLTVNISGLTLSGGDVTGLSFPNSAGGAIYNDHSILTLSGSTISGNTATFGAGIYSNGATSGSATLNIINSTISGNNISASGGEGGGVYSNGSNGSATLNVTNSTISGNTARTQGGGIYMDATAGSGPVTITNSTITNNRANNFNSGGVGGGLGIFGNSAVTLRNSIVALNYNGASPSLTADDIQGNLVTATSFNNLIGDGTNMSGVTNNSNGNQVGTGASPINPLLGALASNGGPTQTHALLVGSPALDAGSNTFVVAPPFLNTSPITDQRGTNFQRVLDSNDSGNTTQTVDIGAFEAQVSISNIGDQTTNEDVSITGLGFNVGDTSEITSITATSNNPGLVQSITVNNPTTATPSLDITLVANASGAATITVTVNGANSQSMADTFLLTVNPVADTPSVTNAATFINQQTTSGLVITKNGADGAEVTHFKITNIQNGTLFKNNGATQINSGDFITLAEGADNGGAGLKFTPANNSTTAGSFDVQAAIGASDTGISPVATATITVNKYDSTITITSDNPDPSFTGQSVTVNFEVTNDDGGPVPTGTVDITISGGAETCQGTLNGSGQGSCSLTLTVAGNPRTFTATYNGDTLVNSDTDTEDHVVVLCAFNPVVNSTDDVDDGTCDSTHCSLREAIKYACPDSEITFDAAVTPFIQLGSALPDIDRNLTITGPGANVLEVRGIQTSGSEARVFNITSGATVAISGLTITKGGSATGGGGINIASGTTLNLSDSAVTFNSALLTGGAGISNAGALTIERCTISNNTSSVVGGGGIFNAGTLTVRNSTIANNTANGLSGGGILNNSAGVTTIESSTIALNAAGSGTGGGIFNTAGTFNISNTIVGDNTANSSPDLSGTFNSAGYNLFENTTGAVYTPTTGDQSNVDPKLQTLLTDNGGPTLTLALLDESPAIDKGNTTLAVDQRNQPRPIDNLNITNAGSDGDDIGAFEAPAPTDAPDLDTASDTGAATNDEITSDNTPTFTISGVQSGDEVYLLRDGVVVTNNTAAGTSIQLTEPSAVADGSYSYTARRAVNGGLSPQSTALNPVVIDTTAPTINIGAPSQASANDSTVSVDYTVTYTGADTIGLDSGDITLNKTGTADATVGVSCVANVCTVTLSSITGNGTLGISIAAGTASDTAGNSAAAAGPSTTFTVDADPPTVSMTSGAPDPTNTSPIPVTVTFSEPVLNFASTDITPGNATVNNFVSNPGGASYTFDLTPTAQGTVTADINAGVANDAALNPNTAATQFSRVFDSVAPSVGISAPSASASNGSSNVTYTVTYTDPNFNASTLSTGDITLNKTGTADATVGVSCVANVCTVTLSSITGNGTLGISIAAGTASDTAGNSAAAAGPSTTFTVDTIAPTINIGAPSASLTNGSNVTFTVTYTDINFNASTLSTGDITLNKTGTADATVGVSAGSGDTRTVTLSSITGNGTLGISIAAGTASDTAGNSAGAAGPSTTFTVDTDEPTVAMSTTATDPTKTSPIPVKVTFNEPVFGFTVSDITAGNATIGGFTGADGDSIYNFTLTPTAQGTITANIAAGVAADAAGNDNTAATQFSITFDNVAPTVSITAVAPDPRNTSVNTIQIVFSEAITGFDLTDLTLKRNGGANLLTGAQTLTNPSADNKTWILGNLDPLTGTAGSYALTVLTSNITDIATNALAANATETWVVDTSSPNVTINKAAAQADPATNTTEINFTVVFTEPVTDFDDAADVELSTSTAGGTLSATITEIAPNNGTTYNVKVTGMNSSGDVIASVNANAAKDTSGNDSAASTSTDNVVAYIKDADTTYEVNSTANTDDGNCTDVGIGNGCTLREAINAANLDGGHETITFAAALTSGGPATILLNGLGALPDITDSVTIEGPVNNRLTISGNNNSRVFTIALSQTVNISNLTIADGKASVGGGIYNLGDLTIRNSTFTGNHADFDGGAIDSDSGKLTILNSTISGNTADGGGGGIHNCGNSTAVLTNVTITNNRADADDVSPGEGGGVEQVSSNTITLRNTIVAGNFQGSGSTADDLSGTFTVHGSLIQTPGSATLTNLGGTVLNQDPQLAGLANNGGPTQTHLLLPGSPAINTGVNILTSYAGLTTDQRGTGFARQLGLRVDIGAVEVNYAISATAGTPQSAVITTAFATQLQATVTESGNPQNNLSVTFNAPVSGASGTFAVSSTVSTNPSGVATAPVFTANGTTGNYNVTASLAGGSPSTTFALTNTKANQTITFNALGNKAFGDADFTVSATATSGLAVSFAASGQCTVSGNTVHLTGAGSCTVTASQAGNANYNAAPSVQQSFNIGKASQTITFNALGDKAFGDADFTVSATATSGLAVSFAASGQCTVSGSTVHITGAGSCTITASQAGNANYNAAPSVQQSFNIGKANQTITFNALGDKTFGNADFNLTATATSGLAVSFAASGNCTVSGNTVHLTGAGSCTITASQAGNANYNAAPDVQRSFNITKANQTITFSALTSKVYGSSDFTVSATASSGLAVSFAATGQCTVSGNTVHITGVGSCTITASQAGNANYNAAPDVPRSFNITKASQTITFNALGNKTFGNADFNLTATATSGLAVSFAASGQCTVSGSTVHITGAGSCTITASQAGNANYNAAPSVQQSFNIGKANQTITFNALGNKTFGDADFTVSATASSGLAVSFAASGNCTVSGNTVHITGAGACTVTASQAGNANFNAAPSVQQSFNIGKANQTITFNALGNKTFGDADFTVSATASSGLAVSFTASNKCTVSGNTVHLTGAGVCTITASQAGNANFNAAVNVARSFQIAKAATTTAVASSANPSSVGQSVTFTATVSSGAGTPTGTVQFKDGATNLGAAVALNASGEATFQTSSLTAGTHSITATYNGSSNFNTSNGTLTGGQVVNVQTSLSINDVTVTEGDSGTTNAVFTVTLSTASNQTVKVDFATANGTATAGSDYQSKSDTLTFNPGDLSKTVTILVNGDTADEPDETFFVNLTNAQNATISDNQGQGTINNDDGSTVQFSSSSYQISEGATNTPQGFASLNVQVTRTGDTSGAATVKYFTSDLSAGNECNVFNGQANQRCDYLLVGATLRFAAGETSKTISIPIVNDGYVEGPEFFSIELANPVGVALGTPSQATLSITDNDTTPTTGANNPYLSNPFFVRQNYLDFLGRDADQAGFTDWNNVLNNCGPEKGFLGAPPDCDRAHVSHGFYASPEFTDTGFLIYRLFEVGMGRLPRYVEFIPDMATLSGFNVTPAVQQQNLSDYLQGFSSKPEFTNRFAGRLLTSQAAALILKMEQTAGVTLPATATTLPNQPTQYGRNELIQKRASGEFTVAETLKAFVEQKVVYDKYFPRGAVTMQYFANLRRDPDLNDPNLLGWTEWVDVFTNGRPAEGIQPRDIHHLIFGFIYSTEYRKRFGTP